MILNNYDIIGGLFIIAAYIFLAAGMISKQSLIYIFSNIIGSIILALYAYNNNSVGFLILQLFWLGTSLILLITKIKRIKLNG